MRPVIELLFVPTEDAAVDAQRLHAVLAERPQGLSRVLFACGETLNRRLVGLVSELSLPWESLHSASPVQSVNRALLLTGHDVLLMAGGFTGVGNCVSELRAVQGENDRAGAIVPTRDLSLAPEAEVSSWMSGSRLPRALTLPVPDMPFALLAREVLDMVGTLDEKLDGLGDALADWALRAQRLGFVTLRASRALVRARPDVPVSGLPVAATLDERHAYYPAQRETAQADFALGFSSRALSGARGDLSVCLDIRYLPEDAINGTSVYAIELSKALTQHTPVKLSFYVASDKQRQALEPLGLPVHVGGELPSHVQLLHRPAQLFRPDHLPLLLRSPVPYVISYQDLIAYRAGSVWRNGADQKRYQLTSYVSVRAAQGIIAISDHNRRELIREFQVPEEHVRTVYHGVDAAAFARRPGEDSAAVLRPMGLPRRFFLFIGSDYAHKNVRLLLASYVNFRTQWKHREDMPGLVLVGHPSGTVDGVFPHLRQRPMPGVHYVGGVSHEVLRALYHQAIAYVYLSAYEGFGLPLLEAMAAETPILCSRFSSIPEVAGDAALYAEEMNDTAIARQMVELAWEPSLGRQLAARGQQRVAQFTWKQTALKTYEVYREAIQRPSTMSLTDRRWLTELVTRPLLP
jgi:glycosyltransferase involved in cell wall biosynthesis